MAAERKNPDNPGAFAGLIVIAIGVVFLLDRNGIIDGRDLARFWPAVLIAAGIAKVLQSSCDAAGRIWGAILIGAGGIFLSNNLGYTHIGFGDIWPLAIIGVGVLMLVRALEGGREFGKVPPAEPASAASAASAPADPAGEPAESYYDWRAAMHKHLAVHAHGSRWSSATRVSHWAIFSGFERQFTTPDFEGGELVAVFGGCEIDLRRAGLKYGKAVINATAVFGGIEIRVPETWEVVLRGTGAFGGYSDTTHPVPDPAARTGTLWVQGAAVFGGVEIKN